mmetsp:Transcript_3776/g.5154  ORF Transcript_3776/g.5154 Transcript_3776/m.5154 type:complete len:269 (-) Transcript_3776:174-980(-)
MASRFAPPCPQTIVSQVLLLQQGRILLGTWKDGHLKGRKTGMLGEVKKGEDPLVAGARVASEVACVHLDSNRLERRGIFTMREKISSSINRSISCSSEQKILNKGHDTDNRTAVEFVDIEEHELIYEASPLEMIEPKETEWIKPEWFDIDDIPFDHMPMDDREWYPSILEGQCMRGTFTFDGDRMLDHEIWTVPRIILDILREAPNGDLNELQIADLKYIALCTGLKNPKISWWKVAPPRSRKKDLIKSLTRYDRQHQKWKDDWYYSN